MRFLLTGSMKKNSPMFGGCSLLRLGNPFLCAALSMVLVTACSSESMPNSASTETTSGSSSVDLNNAPASELPLPVTPAAANAVIDYAAQLFIAEEQTATGIETVANARFYRLTNPLDSEPNLQRMTNLDVCEIGSEASQLNAETLNFPIDHMLTGNDSVPIQVTPIVAGQSVELSSSAGSFLSLSLDSESFDVLEYHPEEGADLNMSVPEALMVNVDGDAIPQLEWQWRKPPVLNSDLRTAVRAVASNPSLVWSGVEQTDSAQSRVHLYAGYINELNGAYQSFTCELADDGAFTMPEDIQALYENGFKATFVDLVRYTRSVQTVAEVSVVTVFMQKN